ncbi:HIT-like protein [Collybia nuda]|uniref:HIT-like protein n=1 Tax=Collybia nuda TaxID=64659 RepID=A0A9P5YI26_9AGAR|nr:HIT-like protein [Collybia nuda]
MSLLFSTIEVTRQAFYRSSLSYAIVNLKPIVPGHLELSSLMGSVQRVGKVIERAYGADALTIACQDGRAAGQSVPHVHFHLLPRKYTGDRFSGNNDEVYPALEENGESLSADLLKTQSEAREKFRVDADDDRHPRSMEDMEEEALWLKGFFEADGQPTRLRSA